MTLQGTLILELLSLGLAAMILNSVRHQRLYVGYAVIWLVSLAGFMVLIAIPPLLELVTRTLGAFFPVSALTMLAFALIFLVLIYLTVQLTLLSMRLTDVCRYVAAQELERKLEEERRAAGA